MSEPQTEALTAEEERALREAIEHGDRWPKTAAIDIIHALLATLAALREALTTP